MKLLEERIIADGKVIGDDILKVDMFLNHQIDVHLLQEIGKEFKRRFDGCNINKILTIEASGIGIACITAQYFSVPVVFAKKGAHKNVGSNVYSSVVHSFTKGTDSNVTVSKDYINKGDKILIIDDFLANGAAVSGLIDIINQAGAELVGVGIAIEKGFQPGGDELRREGIARELVNRIQNIRKSQGFEITDKIDVVVTPNAATDEAVREYADYIGRQVLAESVTIAEIADADRTPLDMDEYPDLSASVKIHK